MLYGREREIQRLVTNLEQGVHTLVFGSAGVGKSALLREAARRLSYNRDSARLAAYASDCGSRKAMLRCALESLAPEFQAAVPTKECSSTKRRGFLLKDLRNTLIRISHDRPLCLLLDHLPRIHGRMRHLLEMLEEYCTFAFGVTAARNGYDLYFYKFDIMEIGCLPRESAHSWIGDELRLLGYNRNLRDSIGIELFRLTGGNPGAISRTLDVIRRQRTQLDDPIRVRRMIIEGRIGTIASMPGVEK